MLIKIRKIFGRLLVKCKKGQTAMEYALIVGGVSIIIYAAMNTEFAGKFKKNIGQLGDMVVSGMLTGDASKNK